MGMDPVTIGLGLSAASGIYGAISGNNAQKKQQEQAGQNFDWQRQVYQDQTGYMRGRNQQVTDLIMPYLNRGGSDFNTGQDGLMQLARGGGTSDPNAIAALTRAASGNTGFDNSELFRSIKGMSDQNLGDQLVQARGAAGSLGQRFGTAQQTIESRLRERATTGLASTYAQVGQQSWENAQNRAVGAGQSLLQNDQANSGIRLGAFNALGQGDARTNQLLGLIAGLPVNPGSPTPQQQIIPGQNQLPSAIGDIGNLAILYPFLRGMQTPPSTNYNSIGQSYRQVFPNFY